MKKPSKTALSLVLAGSCAALLAPGSRLDAQTAQTVYSKPAGFVKLGDTTPGNPAVKSNTDVSLAIPLERELVYSGQVASVSTDPDDTITVAGTPDWTPGEWAPSPGTPYVAIITSGTESGLRALIMANDEDTLTVELATPGSLGDVSASDSIVIRKCWTLKTIFEDVDLDNNCHVYLYDPSPGINKSSSRAFYYSASSGKWTDDFFRDADDTVIYPGERFVLRSRANPIPDLMLFGEVRDSKFVADLSKVASGQEEDFSLAHADPIPVAVGDLDLPKADGDTILIYDNGLQLQNKSSSFQVQYWAWDDEWHDLSNFQVVSDTFMIQPGQGFIYRREASSPDDATWQMQPAPFEP